MSENIERVEATLFNVQHFCLHDGPGIRTTVFSPIQVVTGQDILVPPKSGTTEVA